MSKNSKPSPICSSHVCIRTLLSAYRKQHVPHKVSIHDGNYILTHPFSDIVIESNPFMLLMKAGKKRIFKATNFRANTYRRMKNAIVRYYDALQAKRIAEE